jgi:uncharacterized damage-inducible protein DinB
MTDHPFVKLYEHNNWANLQIIRACAALSDEQLDAVPDSATMGTIRETLTHFVRSQQGYLSLLTLPVEQRKRVTPAFDELEASARRSGEALVALAREMVSDPPSERLVTSDGYYSDPWVVMVQVINHATEHREQIKSMLSALGLAPPDIDGWDYGEVTGGLVPKST